MFAEHTPQPTFRNPTRKRIYEHVAQRPGVHMRQIHRDLALPLSTLEYHLHRLEASERLVTRRFRNFKSYFVRDGLGREDRDYLYFLRQEMPRRIALEVGRDPGITFKALSERLPVTSSTVSFHLKKLVNADIVRVDQVGRSKMYELADAQRVLRLVDEYRPSFADAASDRFADAWMDVRP